MPVLLIKLNGVPEDEAQEIRELLDERGIEFYETHAGRWGVSLAGIWLRDDAPVEEARRLLADYQEERGRRMREEWETRRRAGEVETVVQRLLRRPLQSLLYAVAIAVILYFTLMPFLRW